MYKLLIRPILFLFDPEGVHHFTFWFIKQINRIPGVRTLLKKTYSHSRPALARDLFGIHFENPVGLAAGFDKDALLTDELSNFGFGFIEIGTLTPLPQPGNDKPRLFRLKKDQAVINRMGFNNGGVEAAVKRLKSRTEKVIIGGNIGKNKMTANEHALDDYTACFHQLAPVVDYFVINVSSPNTPGLRALQEKGPLLELMSGIKKLSLELERPKPVLLKIAPDLNNDQLNDIIEILKVTGTDGVIATNTTINRQHLVTSDAELNKIGPGGLSGKPLINRSNEVIRYLRANLGPDFPIIGVGGIMSEADARSKFEAGANLIQLYTGFIYEGPGIVKRILRAL